MERQLAQSREEEREVARLGERSRDGKKRRGRVGEMMRLWSPGQGEKPSFSIRGTPRSPRFQRWGVSPSLQDIMRAMHKTHPGREFWGAFRRSFLMASSEVKVDSEKWLQLDGGQTLVAGPGQRVHTADS